MGTWSWRRLSPLQSYAQKSFGSITRKGTDSKGKRLFSPHRFFYKLIANVKGMSVISHMLHPVPINRWTVPPYCTRWLVFTRVSCLDFCFLSSRRYKCNSILFLFIRDDIKRYTDDFIWLFILSLISCTLLLSLTYSMMMKVLPSWPSSEDHYILREIMFRRTKGINF
jgi:hypothetical protein